MNYNNMNNNNMNNNNMSNNNMNNNNIFNNNNNNMNNNNMINNAFNFNNNYINVSPQKSFNDGMNNINNNNINMKKLQKNLNKIGLENLGHSSYMNASLQCLFNIEILSKKLLKKYFTLNSKTQQLACAYTSLLFELINTTSKSIIPSLFKSIIGELNPLFQGNKTSDPRELIFFIIERLHQELKPPTIDKNLK